MKASDSTNRPTRWRRVRPAASARGFRFPWGLHAPAHAALACSFWSLCGVACVPPVDGTVVGPEPDTTLSVVAAADATNVFVGESIALSASAAGGTPPYSFLWEVNDSPIVLDLSNERDESPPAGPLEMAGRYAFRVTVTDAAGLHAVDYVSVEASNSVEADVPPLAVTGAPTILRASGGETGERTIAWTVVSGQASLDNPSSAVAHLTAEAPGTINLQLTVTIGEGPDAVEIVRNFEVVAVANLAPRVLVETSAGDFTIELDAEAALLHAANFLLYVDDRFYDGLLIHRVACTTPPGGDTCEPFVIQGGGYRQTDGELAPVEPTRDPVPSEADNGLSNGSVYSIALALSPGDPNSGTTQFFVNLSPGNTFLDEQEFTVFGQVVSGTEVVDAIAGVETTESPVIPGEPSLPAADILIERISRIIP